MLASGTRPTRCGVHIGRKLKHTIRTQLEALTLFAPCWEGSPLGIHGPGCPDVGVACEWSKSACASARTMWELQRQPALKRFKTDKAKTEFSSEISKSIEMSACQCDGCLSGIRTTEFRCEAIGNERQQSSHVRLMFRNQRAKIWLHGLRCCIVVLLMINTGITCGAPRCAAAVRKASSMPSPFHDIRSICKLIDVDIAPTQPS